MPDDNVVDDASDGNDTNEDSLLYFARISNHYLRLVTTSNSSTVSPQHSMTHLIIAGSGANYHMFRDKEFFETLYPSTGSVYLGDGKKTLPIQGVGTVKCVFGSHILSIPDVRYIPTLSENIYSLFQHIQSPNHKLESSYDQGLFLVFPTFTTKALVGQHDIYLDALPITHDSTAAQSHSLTVQSSTPLCRNIMEFQNNLQHETKQLDNILRELCQYYADIKTKRQLGLDIPAGFQRSSDHQKEFILYTPP